MIKSEPYFWAECDRCGERAEYGDFSAMSDASQAVDGLDDLDWITISGKEGVELHYCEGCTVWSDEEDQFVVNMEPFVKAVADAQ